MPAEPNPAGDAMYMHMWDGYQPMSVPDGRQFVSEGGYVGAGDYSLGDYSSGDYTASTEYTAPSDYAAPGEYASPGDYTASGDYGTGADGGETGAWKEAAAAWSEEPSGSAAAAPRGPRGANRRRARGRGSGRQQFQPQDGSQGQSGGGGGADAHVTTATVANVQEAAAVVAAAASAAPACYMDDDDNEDIAQLSNRLAWQMRQGGTERLLAITEVRVPGVGRRLAFDARGCRVVQEAMTHQDLGCQAQADIAADLKGHVVEAMRSPHANYVIQRIVEVLTAEPAGFVAEELLISCKGLVRERYGCRIFCRLLEYSPQDTRTIRLIDEVLTDAGELCRHFYGHHVLQTVLEHGLPWQRQAVIQALLQDLPRNVESSNAMYVIEKALQSGSEAEKAGLTDQLTGLAPNLARTRFGHVVVKELLKLGNEISQRVRQRLSEHAEILLVTKHGKRVLAELGVEEATSPF